MTNVGTERGLVLMERDYVILREVSRWKFCLGRQLRLLASFAGERACDRRLRRLIDFGYLERKYILYGVPGLYFLGENAKRLGSVRYYSHKLKLDEVEHDIAVIDTAVYMARERNVPFTDFMSERELHSKDGFSNRKHQPDFVFEKDGQKCAVEIEFHLKNRQRFMNNIQDNYERFDSQIWVIPRSEYRIKQALEESGYHDLFIMEWEEIKRNVKGFSGSGEVKEE